MTARARARSAVTGSLAVVTLLTAGCGASPITTDRLRTSIAPAFARLYVLQQTESGNPEPRLAQLHPQARCVKGTPAQQQRGAGNDWVCYVSYFADGPNTKVTATYLVTVQPGGCYTADGDGPVTLNGRPTITGPGFAQVTNPLYRIDGCFNVG